MNDRKLITDVEMLNGPQRAALLLMYLDRDTAKSVVAHMAPADLHDIGMAMSTLNRVSEAVIEQLVGAFVVDLNRTALLPSRGEEFALNVLPSLVDDTSREQLTSSLKRALSTEFERFISGRAPAAVSAAIADEHPQVQAVALLLMGPESAGGVLAQMDEDRRQRIVARMARIDMVTEEAAEDVEQAVRSSLAGGDRMQLKLPGVERTAKALSKLEAMDRQSLLDGIADDEPALSEELRRRLFVFDDLTELSDRHMQALMREIPREALVTALRGVPKSLLERFTKNMSSRAADDLVEEIEVRGALPRSKVDAARNEIIASARRLADEGAIHMPGTGAEML